MTTRHVIRRSVLLRSALVIGFVVSGVSSVPTAFAGRPDTVDPNLMEPALNPSFAPWTCWRAGATIVCEGSKTETYTGLEVDFLACEGGPIYSAGTLTSTARRIGDPTGQALETAFRDRYVETFSANASGEDARLRSIGRLQHTFSYGVAGDPSTVSETLAGIGISVTGPGFGVVLHDVGTAAWDSEGGLLRLGGIHPPTFSEEEWQATHDRICSVFEPGS